jgi:hypothetical protein
LDNEIDERIFKVLVSHPQITDVMIDLSIDPESVLHMYCCLLLVACPRPPQTDTKPSGSRFLRTPGHFDDASQSHLSNFQQWNLFSGNGAFDACWQWLWWYVRRSNFVSSKALRPHEFVLQPGVVGAAKSLAEAIVINRRLRCVALNEKSPHSLTIDQLSQDILSHQAAKHFDFWFVFCIGK